MVAVTATILLALVVLLLLSFRKNIVNYWQFRKKVYKLPQTEHHFLFGHIWQFLVPRNKIADVAVEFLGKGPSMFVFWSGSIASYIMKDPKYIEVILGNSECIDKPFFYTFLSPWLGTGLLTSTGSKWHAHRKMITPAFHFKILENYVEIFAEKSKIFVNVLQKEIGSKVFDIQPYVSKCTLDIICETAMGVEVNAQQKEESEYVRTVKKMTEEVNRRLLSPWLSPDFIYYLTPGGRKLKKYVSVLHKHSNKVIRDRKELYKRIKMGKKHDEDLYLETAMGVEVNAQQKEESEYVRTVKKMTEEVNRRLLSPWLSPDFIYYLTPGGRKLKKYVSVLHKHSNKVIRDRKELYKRIKMGKKHDEDLYLGKQKKMAFLDLLFECSENGGNLTDEEIREEVDTFMFEGHDTTSAAIGWLLHGLSTNQNYQDKIFEELQSILGDSDRSPTMKDLNEMKYLERVIKEMLRLCPSVPLIGRVLKKDVQIDGYTLPAGLMIGFFVPTIHRNPEYFPNPEEFDPDNFLPERVAGRHPYAYIPFSAGPRNCIGQKFALLEEKMIVSYIVRHYKLHSSEIEPVPAADLIMRSCTGFHIQITARSPDKSK